MMTAKTRKRTSKAADAIALLKGDHRRVAGLFKKFEEARGPAKAALARDICLELSVHTLIEETLFYPAVSGITQVAGVATMVEKDAVTDKDRNKALTYAFSIQFARKAGIPTNASDYPHSGVQERMQVLYKFLASCRGARTGAVADSGKCWPCPTDANLTGNWALLSGFQTGIYGPLYAIQDNSTVTAVDPGDVPAARNSLFQNRPNPFNPSTAIPFTTAIAGRAWIRVYDVAGRLIRTIDAGPMEPGEHVARWDGRNQGGDYVGSGVYFYRIEFPGGGATSRKMILLR